MTRLGSVKHWYRRLRPGLVPWLVAAVATAVLIPMHPFTGDLDRGTILAIAGLILGIAVVTVGFVGVLAQHLTETYARSLVKALLRRSTWQTAAVAEGASVVVMVGLALWRADLTTGAVAAVALCASMAASWAALLHQFQHFDPVSLIELDMEDALRRLVAEKGEPAAARQPSQSILSLILSGARKGDTDVVYAGLSAWNAILERYLQLHTVVWNDEYFYWVYARVEELIEQNARESVGLVLPAIVEGMTTLGSTAARVRNPLNAGLDEGTALLTEALVHVVELSGMSKRSPAAELAAQGIGEIGLSCLEADKFIVLQQPIEALLKVAIGTAATVPGVSRRAMIGLARQLLVLAESESPDVMRGADAERIVQRVPAVVAGDAGGDGGPSYILVAPMSEISIARLTQALAQAGDREHGAYRRRQWDGLVSAVASLCPAIYARRTRGSYVGAGTIETAAATILGLLAVDSREAIDKLIVDLSRWLIELTVVEEEEHHPADEVIGAVCLATYEASSPPNSERHSLREISTVLADGVRSAGTPQRRHLSPILRQVGAAALHFGDEGFARHLAASTLPDEPGQQRGIGVNSDPFTFGGLGQPHRIRRPGVLMAAVQEFHRYPSLQQGFLAIEEQMHAARTRKSRRRPE